MKKAVKKKVSKSSESEIFPRQQNRVLELLAEGYAINEISRKMGLTYHTVSCYLRILRKKLKVNKTSLLAIWYLKEQIRNLQHSLAGKNGEK